MENSLKGLILAAGTVITCLVISLGFYLSNEAQETANTGTQRIGRINTEFAESDKMVYQGAKVSGSEVANAIRKLSGEKLGVYVVTKEAQIFYGCCFDLTTGELKDLSDNTYDASVDETSGRYINPYGTFIGQVVRNTNGVITGIVFTQN